MIVYFCGRHCLLEKQKIYISIPSGDVKEQLCTFSTIELCDQMLPSTYQDIVNMIIVDEKVTSWRKFKNLIRLLLLESPINSTPVNYIIQLLHERVKKTEVFNAILVGCRNVTGKLKLDLGNAVFLAKIMYLLHVSKMFAQCDINSTLLSLSGELHIDAKTFIMLSEEDQYYLLNKHCSSVNFTYVLGKNRFFTEHKLLQAKQEINLYLQEKLFFFRE